MTALHGPNEDSMPPAKMDDLARREIADSCAADPLNAQQDAESHSAGEELSAEEQMERFEAYLKENDCGHRPC
jgi:hypothetical protein